MWTIHFLCCFEVKLFAADECRANSGQPWSVLVPRTTLLRNPKARLSSAFLDSRALTQRPLLLIDPFQFHTLNWSFKVPEHLDSKFLLSPDGPCLITKVLALPWCHKPSYNRAPTPTFFCKKHLFVCWYTCFVCMWRSEQPAGVCSPFHYVSPGDWTPVFRLGSKHLHWLSHLAGPTTDVLNFYFVQWTIVGVFGEWSS